MSLRASVRALLRLPLVLLLTTCVADQPNAPRVTPTSPLRTLPPPNLLTDPGFDLDGQGWQNVTALGRVLDSARFHGGVAAQRIDAFAGGDRAVFQEVTVVAGTGYTPGGWVATDGIDGGQAHVEILWLDAAGLGDSIPPADLLGTDVVGVLSGTQDWVAVNGAVTAPLGAIVARFQLRTEPEADDLGSAWFDDARLMGPPPPDVTPPTVVITAPASGDTLRTPTLITADAQDDDAVAGVQFLVNGINVEAEATAPPYQVTLNTDTFPTGPIDLSATVSDPTGNKTTSALVRVVVFHPDTTPPVVTITNPQDGATIAGQVTVSADATDDGLVAGVQFLLNGNNLGTEITAPPYEVPLNTATLPNGAITLAAIGRDTAQHSTTSATIHATILNRPILNIVLLMMDDQRFDAFTPAIMPLTYGLLTPEAVTFTRGFVTTSLCCPSRTSLLTGRYSHNTGVLTNELPNGGAAKFDPSSTVATWLHQAGYRTGLIGKYLNEYWRLSPVVPPGWDDFHAYAGTSTEPPYYNYVLNENGTIVSYGSGASNYITDVYTGRAVEFINSTPAGQPLLLFFTPNVPHAPMTPAASDVGRFASFPNWRPPSFNEADVSDKPAWIRALPKITATQATAADKAHRSVLESLQAADRGINAIITALKQNNRWSNTLVIFLSDNGLAWGEHRLTGRKACPYEECIRVPFVVRVPGVAARQDTSLVANVDLAPTIAEWAGVTAPSNVNGVSLLNLIRNPGTSWRTALLVEQLGLIATNQNFQGVRTSRYLYNEYQNGDKELYDLVTDPYQLTSVVKLSKYASIVASLKAILATLKTS